MKFLLPCDYYIQCGLLTSNNRAKEKGEWELNQHIKARGGCDEMQALNI